MKPCANRLRVSNRISIKSVFQANDRLYGKLGKHKWEFSIRTMGAYKLFGRLIVREAIRDQMRL